LNLLAFWFFVAKTKNIKNNTAYSLNRNLDYETYKGSLVISSNGYEKLLNEKV